MSETLYRGRSAGTSYGNGPLFDARMRPMEPSDDHGLFRLYNAATPAPVRSLVAMTFDQWRACREQRGGQGIGKLAAGDGDPDGCNPDGLLP